MHASAEQIRIVDVTAQDALEFAVEVGVVTADEAVGELDLEFDVDRIINEAERVTHLCQEAEGV